MSQFGVETQKISARSARSTVLYPILKIVALPINFVTDLQLAPAPTIPRPPLFEPNLRHWIHVIRYMDYRLKA